MDYNDESSSTTDIIQIVKKPKISSLCKVCGTEGAQIHYGALCCVSCKMFFRRNIQFDLDIHQCVFNEKCDITINSRRACRYCRLQKCLAIGMQRELLRASHCRQGKSDVKTVSLLPPIDLRYNNRSVLTDNQWSHLSNIINAYNTKSPVGHVRQLLSTQSKHPIKVRFKMDKTYFLDIIISIYQSILPFVETLPEFQTMHIHDRRELIDRNLSYVGGFNSILVFRDAEVVSSTAFKNGFPSIYGSTIANDASNVAHRTDNDVTLIKLFIPVLLFSTSYYGLTSNTVNNSFQFNRTDMDSIFSNTNRLFYIQNIYIEILFKYMIYRFGYYEASLRFAALVKSFLDQSMCILRAGEIQAHDQVIQTIVKKTEVALAFDSDSMD
ncbi:unnamed protein product [Adineta steineri]|uniref:Nuclear receptor domain-containing protein n=1 Tax=Adineta steineri TaxID=433720 RepID=A0A819G149_9BILA|nr:unnamed protein product [Adineta steineri]CAF3877967.1 unnamed protein product [Adineta steineri]